MDVVKGGRPNAANGASSTRARQAAATRAQIVAAATMLFERDGYVGTSITSIAREAGVAVQTIYNAVGSKRDLLDAVLDAVAAGPEAPRPVRDFMVERGQAVTTAVAFVAMLADWFAEVQPRVAGVMRLIREAAATDPEIATLETRRASQRLTNYHRAAELLADLPGARARSTRSVAGTIWNVGHPQTYAQFVEADGWSLDEYRQWVEETLRAALVEDATAKSPFASTDD